MEVLYQVMNGVRLYLYVDVNNQALVVLVLSVQGDIEYHQVGHKHILPAISWGVSYRRWVNKSAQVLHCSIVLFFCWPIDGKIPLGRQHI